jgi:glyoxylase-like metal-dependent hydrolase (beta-lactamase superfamily II)
MQIGSFTVELLSEGRFEVFRDGHINRTTVDDESTKTELSATGQSSIVGINPILIKTGPENILLDTGLGWGLDAGSEYRNVSNVQTNLDIFDLEPGDITHVVLSHLHYDHAAGCSFTDSYSQTKATFPNARYFVHQKEWDFALTQVDQEQKPFGADYRLDDIYRLVADKRIEFLSGESTEILDGINVFWTGGHTPGHQIIAIHSNGESAYYLGDLLPSSAHLNHYAMSHMDVEPVQAKKMKVQLLRKACNQQAILLFYHSKYGQSGRLIRNKDKQYALTEITKP